MGKVIDLITKADILGVEAKLYFQADSDKSRSLFGGIISIIMILLMYAGSLFFAYLFFNRQELVLISNSKEDNSINYSNYNGIPLMVRISGNGQVVFPSNYYYMVFFLADFDEKVGSSQKLTYFPVETCDPKKHFLNKTSIFKEIIDYSTYYCPNYGNTTVNLTGIYGSTKYSYLLFQIFACNNSTACAPKSEVLSGLASSFLDYVTISNEVEHYSTTPNKEIVSKGRIAVSSTIYKRIWLYMERVIYYTDFGYIFSQKERLEFFNVKTFSVDLDLRDVQNNNKPFTIFTILNHPTTTTFSRAYMKVQTLLANIGGIIQGLTVLGKIFCYPITMFLTKMKIINSVHNKRAFRILSELKLNESVENLKDNPNQRFQSDSLMNSLRKNNEHGDRDNRPLTKEVKIEDSINKNVQNIEDKNLEQDSGSNAKKLVSIEVHDGLNKKINMETQEFKKQSDNENSFSQSQNLNNKKNYFDESPNNNKKEKIKYFDIQETKTIIKSNNISNKKLNISPLQNDKSTYNFNKEKTGNNILNKPDANDLNQYNSKSIALAIMKNNFTKPKNEVKLTNSFEKIKNRIKVENEKNKNKNIITKEGINLSPLALLDPFLLCIGKEKKFLVDSRLRQFEHLLNQFNIISIIQQFNLVKSIFFDDSQLMLISKIFEDEADSKNLTSSYWKVKNKALYGSEIDKKLISELFEESFGF